MADIALSAAVRDSLLSLQGTTNLIERTQGRLSSGLKVAGPIDDPVSFFQAKGLNDRAFDFNEKKDGIDQGISTLTAALDGVDAIETLVRQLKGVAQSLKSAEEGQVDDLISQFNDLRNQINNLATDATYQGTNLINGSQTVVEIEFSEKTASLLTINSVNLTVDDTTGGLNIQSLDKYTGEFVVNHGAFSAQSAGGAGRSDFYSAGSTLSFTWQGPDQTYTSTDSVTFTLGDDTLTIGFASATVFSSTGTTFDVTLTTGATTGDGTYAAAATETTNFAYDVCAVSFSAGVRLSCGSTAIYTAGAAQSGERALLTTSDKVNIVWQGETLTFGTADNGSQTVDVNGVTFEFVTTSGFQLTAGAVIELDLNADTANIAANAGLVLVASAAGVQGLSADVGTAEITYFAAADLCGVAITTSDAGYVGSAGTVFTNFTAVSNTTAELGILASNTTASLDQRAQTAAQDGADYVRAGDTVLANLVIDDLDSALTTLRTESQNLGTNVAVLQTRLDFTETYVNTLEGGAGKLTLADINEEGANLLALQTRQQLGIQSLSFAGQAEQQILSLFR